VRFVDTSFWIAIRNVRDGHHGEAARIWAERSGPLLSSSAVVGESWTFMRRRLGHGAAVKFLDRVQRSPLLTIVHVDESLEEEAWGWLRRHDERDYSFVDATSFALMRRRRLREALAFDGDFSAAGFVEARAAV
jgi:predicted nucleic acid-binding protein